MNDMETRIPEPESEEALEDVEALGGDADVMESLPAETDDDTLPASDESENLLSDEPIYEMADDTGEPVIEYADSDDAPDLIAEAELYEEIDPYAGLLDVDAALASVASLGEFAPRRETDDRAELRAAQVAQVQREKAEIQRRARPVQAPPPLVMRRGQLASVVPALALILVGGWLTFALTAPGALPNDPLLVGGVIAGAVVLTMLAQWLSAGRWSRGVFFFAVLALLVAGAVFYATNYAANAGLIGPLALLAAGAAFLLTAILARPKDRRLLLPGLVFLVAGGVVLAAQTGVLPAALVAGAAPFWPLVVVVLVVLWLLPVVARRRG